MVPGAWGLCDVARVHVCAFGVYEGIGMHAEPMGGETGELWETRLERMLTIEATADDVQIRRWFKSSHVTKTSGPFREHVCTRFSGAITQCQRFNHHTILRCKLKASIHRDELIVLCTAH